MCAPPLRRCRGGPAGAAGYGVEIRRPTRIVMIRVAREIFSGSCAPGRRGCTACCVTAAHGLGSARAFWGSENAGAPPARHPARRHAGSPVWGLHAKLPRSLGQIRRLSSKCGWHQLLAKEFCACIQLGNFKVSWPASLGKQAPHTSGCSHFKRTHATHVLSSAMPLRGGLLIKVKTLTGKVRASDPRTHARAVAPAEFQTRWSTWQKRCLRAPKDGTTAHPRRVDALTARAAHGLATRQGYRVGAQTLARRLGREGVCGDGVGCHRRDSCGPCARQEIKIDIDQSDSITHIKVTAHPGTHPFPYGCPVDHHITPRGARTCNTSHAALNRHNEHTHAHTRAHTACV